MYDPDPDGSYEKAKLESLKRSIVSEHNVLGQTSLYSACFDNFLPDRSMLFSKDVSVLPSVVPMDAFENLKIRESHQGNAPHRTIPYENSKFTCYFQRSHLARIKGRVNKGMMLFSRSCVQIASPWVCMWLL